MRLAARTICSSQRRTTLVWPRFGFHSIGIGNGKCHISRGYCTACIYLYLLRGQHLSQRNESSFTNNDALAVCGSKVTYFILLCFICSIEVNNWSHTHSHWLSPFAPSFSHSEIWRSTLGWAIKWMAKVWARGAKTKMIGAPGQYSLFVSRNYIFFVIYAHTHAAHVSQWAWSSAFNLFLTFLLHVNWCSSQSERKQKLWNWNRDSNVMTERWQQQQTREKECTKEWRCVRVCVQATGSNWSITRQTEWMDLWWIYVQFITIHASHGKLSIKCDWSWGKNKHIHTHREWSEKTESENDSNLSDPTAS